MIWVPIALGSFKLVVLGIGMFFSIKSHYDEGKRRKLMREEAAAEPPAEQSFDGADQLCQWR